MTSFSEPVFSRESWRYTKGEQFLAGASYPIASDNLDKFELPREVVRLLQGFENQIVFYNGTFSERLSSVSAETAKINTKLDFLTENPIDIENEKSAVSGYTLEVDASSDSANVALVFLYGNRLNDETKSFRSVLRNHLRIKGKGQANILELHIALNEVEYFVNNSLLTEIEGAAKCQRLRYFWTGGCAYFYDHQKLQITGGATLANLNFVTGGKWSRFNESVNLTDALANVDMTHMCLLGGGQQSDLSSHLNHLVGDTVANQKHKSLLVGKSKSSFTGKISIAQDAQKSAASQKSYNLVLDDHCEVNTRPQLEVLADDVKANHGATVGQLSDEEIFYLQSRGIDADKARQLVAQGHVMSCLDVFSEGILRASAKKCLEASMQQFMKEASFV